MRQVECVGIARFAVAGLSARGRLRVVKGRAKLSGETAARRGLPMRQKGFY